MGASFLITKGSGTLQFVECFFLHDRQNWDIGQDDDNPTDWVGGVKPEHRVEIIDLEDGEEEEDPAACASNEDDDRGRKTVFHAAAIRITDIHHAV